MAADFKIISLLILLHTKGLGRTKAWKLIENFGTPENAVKAGWDTKKRRLFEKWEISDWEKHLESAEKEKVHLVTFQDAIYPKNLLKNPHLKLYI